MTYEAVGLIDPLSTIQRLGGTRPGVHEPISALPGQRQLTARHGHRALDRRNGPGIRLDVALVPHRGEPADLVYDGVGIAGAQQQHRDREDSPNHASPLPRLTRVTAT